MTETPKYHKYVAYSKGDCRIISVMATSEDEAINKVSEQLQRPGRYEYYKAWKANNCYVCMELSEEEKAELAKHFAEKDRP